jgi:hypothetical protein
VGKDYVQEFIGSDFKMIQQVTSGSDHYSIISLEQELKILFMTAHSIKITYNEPAKIVSLPISKVNKTIWNGLEYTNEEEVDTITITSAFIGNEVIETEAGKFDCIKLEYIITKSSGKINKYYEWRAPDVGLVQLTAEVDNKGFVGLMTKLLSVDVIFFVLKEIRKF